MPKITLRMDGLSNCPRSFHFKSSKKKNKKNTQKVDDEHLDDELVPFILQALPTSRPLSIYILGGLSDCKMIIRGCQTCILMHKPKSQSLLHNPTNLLFFVCQAWFFFGVTSFPIFLTLDGLVLGWILTCILHRLEHPGSSLQSLMFKYSRDSIHHK